MQGDPRTHAILGAALEVHRVLGPGFLEAVYQEALAKELGLRSIPFRVQCEIPVFYKGDKLSVGYRVDFICFDSVILELKAVRQLSVIEEAQVLNYLKASGLHVALLLNFGASSLQQRRFVSGHERGTTDFADYTDYSGRDRRPGGTTDFADYTDDLGPAR
jgi:GxxExxY protein